MNDSGSPPVKNKEKCVEKKNMMKYMVGFSSHVAWAGKAGGRWVQFQSWQRIPINDNLLETLGQQRDVWVFSFRMKFQWTVFSGSVKPLQVVYVEHKKTWCLFILGVLQKPAYAFCSATKDRHGRMELCALCSPWSPWEEVELESAQDF